MKKVTIYSTPTCTYCKMAKTFLNEHKYPFTEVDVATDAVKRAEMIEKSGQMGVPVIVVTDDSITPPTENIIVGFDQEELASLVCIEKVPVEA